MIFVFGSRLYGKVERLPNGWYVATRFAHFDFIPLIPTGSFLVTSTQGKQWTGVRIPLQTRSLLMTYGRVFALALCVTLGLLTVAVFLDRHSPDVGSILLLSCADLLAAGIAVASLLVWKTAAESRIDELLRLAHASSISGSLPTARGFDVAPATPKVTTPTAQSAVATPRPAMPLSLESAQVPQSDRASRQREPSPLGLDSL